MRSLLRAVLTLALGAGLAAVPTVVAPAIALAGPSTDYVALGDSYSSGTGTGWYDLSSSCQRSSLAYPPLWVAQQGAASFTFAACAGATTSSVRSSQLGGLSAATDLVSITVGGNDAGFSDTVLACRLGTDAACYSQLDSASAFIQTTLPGLLDATYRDIRARTPGARLVVLGYPRLYRTGFCLLEISDARRTRINAVADLLATVIAQRAAAAGATFVDARGPFSGHEVCSFAPWINGTTFPVGDSYHPNRSGYAQGYLPMLRGVVT
ncbi:MAG: SGNH/GDSL hydrolase family protein [Mycobacteriales bacterium]